MLADFGYAICSHLYFCIGFSTVGNAPKQFIFSSLTVLLFSPLGTEQKSLTGRQFVAQEKKNPNVGGAQLLAKHSKYKKEKQLKKDIWDILAFRDST